MMKLTSALMRKTTNNTLGDLGRRPCYSRDPQEPRDQPNDKKCNGPAQHDGTSFDENLRALLQATESRWCTYSAAGRPAAEYVHLSQSPL